MQKDVSVNLVYSIKEYIHQKFGKKVSYAKDCSVLSDEILVITKRQLSVTTLKRFFGIVESQFQPSKFTLDTLAMYLDYKNWKDFVNNFEKHENSISNENLWDELQNRVHMITDYSLQSMTNKLGSQITEFPLRSFAEKKIESFLQSNQLATAFIAPEGYGKTLLVTQLVRKFLNDSNSSDSKDIIFLNDGRMLFKLLSVDVRVDHICNLLDFEPKTSFCNYFKQYPEQVKGRFVLVIDAINEVYMQAEKVSLFVDNLLKIVASCSNITWFKLIISCRPDTWHIFRHLMKNDPFKKAHWFDVSFEESNEACTNVPLLNPREIIDVLELNHSPQKLEKITFYFPEIMNIIAHPYFLHLFMEIQKGDEVNTDIELLYQYFHEKIINDPIAVEKMKLIDAFFKSCDNAKLKAFVYKDELLSLPNSEIAYKELLSAGVFHEYKVSGNYLSVQTHVEFTSSILLTFFLANKWLKENELDQNLLKNIISFYGNNKIVQDGIIKYIIKIAFKEKKTLFLKDIYCFFQMHNCKVTPVSGSVAFREIISVIGLEFRKNKDIRDRLVSWYAQSKCARLFYFESFFDLDSLVLYSGDSIDDYLKYNLTPKEQLYGYFMKFMQYFLASDSDRCNEVYGIIKEFGYVNNETSFDYGLYYSVQIKYESVFLNVLSSELIDAVLLKSEELLSVGSQISTSIPQFEITIIFALNYGGNFNEIIEVSEYIFNNYDITRFNKSPYFQLFMAIYARALLNTGHIEKALEIFNQVELINVPFNTRSYMNLRYKLILVEFLLVTNQFAKVEKELNDIKTIAKMLQFSYFYQVADNMAKENRLSCL